MSVNTVVATEDRQQEGLRKFNSSIKTAGLFFVTIAMVCNFLPAVYASIVTGQFPEVGQLVALWIAAASAFGVGWFVQPISMYPMTNLAGCFLCWITGNVGDLRLPAANAAQKVTNCEQGSPKAQIMSCLGVTASVFVSCSMLTFFAAAGAVIMPLLPKFVIKAFGYVLPCILGGVYADLCSKNLSLGVIILIVCLVMKKLVMGTPLAPWVMLVNIIIAVIIARVYFMTVLKGGKSE